MSRQVVVVSLAGALLLTGCATVRPAVPDAQAQGFPGSTSTPSPSDLSKPLPATSTAAPTASSVATPPPPSVQPVGSVTRNGITVPIPSGFVDGTQYVTGAPTAGTTRLIAYLRSATGATIAVNTVATDSQTLDAFVKGYVPALNAGGQASVEQTLDATVGPLPAKQLIISTSEGKVTTMVVAMPTPGVLVRVDGPTTTEAARRTLLGVAAGISMDATAAPSMPAGGATSPVGPTTSPSPTR